MGHGQVPFDSRATHERVLLPAVLASVPIGFVLIQVRVRVFGCKFIAVERGFPLVTVVQRDGGPLRGGRLR